MSTVISVVGTFNATGYITRHFSWVDSEVAIPGVFIYQRNSILIKVFYFFC